MKTQADFDSHIAEINILLELEAEAIKQRPKRDGKGLTFDSLVAEHIFKWKRIEDGHERSESYEKSRIVTTYGYRLPSFSLYAPLAEQVVKKVSKMGYAIPEQVINESSPRAVCLFALNAVGVEIAEEA